MQRLSFFERVLRWMHLKHRTRLVLSIISLALNVGAAIALHYGWADDVVEGIKGKAQAVVDALCLVFGLTTLDAGIVERARLDPTRPALPDDVIGAPRPAPVPVRTELDDIVDAGLHEDDEGA